MFRDSSYAYNLVVRWKVKATSPSAHWLEAKARDHIKYQDTTENKGANQSNEKEHQIKEIMNLERMTSIDCSERNNWFIILVHPMKNWMHRLFDALNRISQLTLDMIFPN